MHKRWLTALTFLGLTGAAAGQQNASAPSNTGGQPRTTSSTLLQSDPAQAKLLKSNQGNKLIKNQVQQKGWKAQAESKLMKSQQEKKVVKAQLEEKGRKNQLHTKWVKTQTGQKIMSGELAAKGTKAHAESTLVNSQTAAKVRKANAAAGTPAKR